MYIPKAFREDDIDVLHAFIQEHNFAILFTLQDGVPLATHLPLILDRESGMYGTLRGHMARANTQWRTFDETKLSRRPVCQPGISLLSTLMVFHAL